MNDYSKPVSRENSKCLDFMPVQVKPILQTRAHFLSHAKRNEKMTQWHTKGF